MDHILGPGDSVVPFSHICGQTPALYGDPGAQPHVSFPQGKSQIGKRAFIFFLYRQFDSDSCQSLRS